MTNQEATQEMTTRELLLKEIEQTPEELLEAVLDFLLFLKMRHRKQNSTTKSLLEFAGKWDGDDLEECLEMVYATRSKFYIPSDESDDESDDRSMQQK